MGKTVGELHAMLIEYEKGLPKKAETPQVMMIKGGKIHKSNKKSLKAKAKDDTCHHCKEVGHCKRNCPAYIAELLKKKKQVGSASSSGWLLKSTYDESFENVNLVFSGKMTKKPFPYSNERAKDLLGIIHTNVCGPLRHVSRQGASYFITFTDDYSRYGYVYLLKHKHKGVICTVDMVGGSGNESCDCGAPKIRWLLHGGDDVLEGDERWCSMRVAEGRGDEEVEEKIAEFFEKKLYSKSWESQGSLKKFKMKIHPPSENHYEISIVVAGIEPPPRKIFRFVGLLGFELNVVRLKLVLSVLVSAVKNMLMLPVQVSTFIIMTSLKFAETQNVVVFFEKPKESDGFAEIIDFLKASFVAYALTVNPVIYTSCIKQFWATAKLETVNGVRQIQALVDKKRVIVTESSIRRDLHLDDAEGTACLPTATIFEELARMG
ncbi:retrotransposon protein, putative, ty1-copia subclass [Tanacetum coccineum]